MRDAQVPSGTRGNFPELPRKLFISHAYADSGDRQRLLSVLPDDVEPIIFPPIMAPPQEMVSTSLIGALRDCDGVVYLKGGASDRSFWVAFECDYARRMGKPVFEAEPETLALKLTSEKPLHLPVFASYHHADNDEVTKVCQFMRDQRNFEIWLDTESLKPGEDWQNSIENAIVRYVDQGYLVAFWSRAAGGSEFMRKEIELAANQIGDRFNDRVLFASLDASPLPQFWMKYQDPAVQIYGDPVRPMQHRIDDLIVRLYWMIHRKSKRNGVFSAG